MGRSSKKNSSNNSNKIDGNEDNSNHIDPVFGQARAFNVKDPLVNPLVVEYLQDVRWEALKTNAISINAIPNKKINYGASIYDDDTIEEVGTEKDNKEKELSVSNKRLSPDQSTKTDNELLAQYQYSIDIWLKWYNDIYKKIWEDCYVFEGYDDTTMNQLLHLIKMYLSEKSNDNKITGFERHLLNILRDQYSSDDEVPENASLSIDVEWLQGAIKKMKSEKLRNIEDIKGFIQKSHKVAPKGIIEWYKYIMNNDPTHSNFVNMIDQSSLWTLVDYMTQEWLKDINKAQLGTQKRNQMSKWLLYLLLHIPTQLTAERTSKIRDLGKRGKKILDNRKNTNIFGAEDSIVLTDELKELSPLNPPKNLDMVSLVLMVVANEYGQRDLLELQ
ncbi:Pre-mRNA-splicing factor BRR1 [Nakaseomyces bracarensis]|uniref:Pre-mRNA-splicing factor BRR1 n=1 Tax=Nakaseomyces bracarensis TaxID=273131 RepID=A0ABR4NMG3_9SACH